MEEKKEIKLGLIIIVLCVLAGITMLLFSEQIVPVSSKYNPIVEQSLEATRGSFGGDYGTVMINSATIKSFGLLALLGGPFAVGIILFARHRQSGKRRITGHEM